MIGNLVWPLYSVEQKENKTDLGSAIPRDKGHSSLFLVRIEDWEGRGDGLGQRLRATDNSLSNSLINSSSAMVGPTLTPIGFLIVRK